MFKFAWIWETQSVMTTPLTYGRRMALMLSRAAWRCARNPKLAWLLQMNGDKEVKVHNPLLLKRVWFSKLTPDHEKKSYLSN